MTIKCPISISHKVKKVDMISSSFHLCESCKEDITFLIDKNPAPTPTYEGWVNVNGISRRMSSLSEEEKSRLLDGWNI